MFEINNKVKWFSSGTSKIGTVAYIVPAGADIVHLVHEFEKSGYAVHYGGGCTRDHESYLVRVEGNSERCKPHLYWPRVSALTLA